MTPELDKMLSDLEALEKDATAEAFDDGYRAGLCAYAWWKDGTQYVGTCGTTLAEACVLRRSNLDYAALSGKSILEHGSLTAPLTEIVRELAGAARLAVERYDKIPNDSLMPNIETSSCLLVIEECFRTALARCNELAKEANGNGKN